MDNPTLREIIEVEKDIQQALDSAKVKMRAWVEARKKEADEELARSEADIQNSFQLARENAVRDAGSRASTVVTEAENHAARLAQLENNTLVGIVENHIKKILPQ